MSGHRTASLQTTPVYPLYERAGARVVDFHGWALPVQFSGIIDEHRTVRSAAGLFDVSHMGEIEISGPGALALVQRLTINDAATLADGQVQYSAMCLPDGGIVDDLTVYRRGPERFLLCVNAANAEKDLSWVIEHREGDAVVEDRSASTALLSLQGPVAESILQPHTGVDLAHLPYYHFSDGAAAGAPALISRTGYTGEDGFELFLSAEEAPAVWTRLLESGSAAGLKPAGLGARDTLRLEMKYALYGNDIDETTDPFEAGLGWITRLDAGDFIGREALVERKRRRRRRLAGFVMTDPGVARRGYPLRVDGAAAGTVTSGSVSPTLGASIGLGYLPREKSAPGQRIEIEIRGAYKRAEVVRTPFYTDGSAKKRP